MVREGGSREIEVNDRATDIHTYTLVCAYTHIPITQASAAQATPQKSAAKGTPSSAAASPGRSDVVQAARQRAMDEQARRTRERIEMLKNRKKN